MSDRLALILLASGLSERFGAGNKLLADMNGLTVIERLLKNIDSVKFEHKYAVISDPFARDIVSRYGFVPVQNNQQAEGQGHALRLSASVAHESGAGGVCILLADMPFIDAAYLEQLMKAATKNNIVMSEFAGIKMPPAIFKNSAFTRLLHTRGDRPKPFAGEQNIASLPLTKLQAMDIDTQADLAVARKLV